MTANESIFCQALAMTSLLKELSNKNFLNSDYYEKLTFSDNDSNFKKILNSSGLGNPATLQMFLYALLVMPRELLTRSDETHIDQIEKNINNLCSSLIEAGTNSTYPKENTLALIDYCRHIRNSVAHSRCSYSNQNGVCYVTFKDSDSSKHTCQIIMKTGEVGVILNELQKQLMDYLNHMLLTNPSPQK